MANVFGSLKDVGQWVADRSAVLLASKCSVPSYFDTSYTRQFQPKAGGAVPVGSTFKIPYPYQYSIREGLEYDPSEASRRYTEVSIGQPFGVDVPEIDSLEKITSLPSSQDTFTADYLDPAMSRLAAEIGSRAILYATIHAAGVVGVLGTNPTTYDATSAAARQKMAELLAPGGDKGMFVPPSVMRSVKGSNLALLNPVSSISKQFRQGIVAEQTDGFDWYEETLLYRHTAGTMPTHGATLTSSLSNGAVTAALTCTTGETVKAGDKFTFGSVLPVHPETKRTFGTDEKVFTITAAGTAASSALTISFSPAVYYSGPYQNVDSQPLASAALTFWPGTTSPSGKVGNLGLALPKQAFAMVSLELEKFEDWAVCKMSRDPDSGVSIRFGMGSDIRSSKRVRRFDVCCGWGELYNDLAMVVACG